MWQFYVNIYEKSNENSFFWLLLLHTMYIAIKIEINPVLLFVIFSLCKIFYLSHSQCALLISLNVSLSIWKLDWPITSFNCILCISVQPFHLNQRQCTSQNYKRLHDECDGRNRHEAKFWVSHVSHLDLRARAFTHTHTHTHTVW